MEIIRWIPSPNIMAGTTLRSGGVSNGALSSLNMALNVHDDEQKVIENRQRLALWLNTDFDHMVSPTQTHSTHLYHVQAADGGRGMKSLQDAIDDTDALYTREKNLYLLTYHADCIPVLLYEEKQQLIASIHAGWKGNVHEIIKKTITYLIENENCKAQSFYAYIGPSLSFEHFEARQDIIDYVQAMSFDTTPYYRVDSPGIYHLDAKGLAKAQLLNCGIAAERITVDPHCTKADEKHFFSYRRDHNCGRHVSFIALLK